MQGVTSFFSSVPLENSGEGSDGWVEIASPRVKLEGELIDVGLGQTHSVKKRSIKYWDDHC